MAGGPCGGPIPTPAGGAGAKPRPACYDDLPLMDEPVRPLKYRYFIRTDHGAWDHLRRRLRGYRPVPSFPRVVQIQTLTGCNADCCFCPYGATVDLMPKGRMDDALFERIVRECGREGVSRISPYLTNEPFLDKALLDRIAVINQLAPRARVCLTTNGDPMTPKTVDRMLDAGGVSRIYVSVQGVDPVAYDEVMRGPKLERVIEHVAYLHGELRRRRLTRPRLTVTMVESGMIDVPRALQFWAERGIEAKSTRLENRGGNIDVHAAADGNGTRLAAVPMRQFMNCTRLMRQAFVLHDGRVTLCCTDDYQTTILGDLRTQTLQEVWNGPEALRIRRGFIAGNLADNPLCAACTIAERHVT